MKIKLIFIGCLILVVISVIFVISPRDEYYTEDTGQRNFTWSEALDFSNKAPVADTTIYWNDGLFATLNYELDENLQIINPSLGAVTIIYEDTHFTGFEFADDWFEVIDNEIKISIYGIISSDDGQREYHRLTTNLK